MRTQVFQVRLKSTGRVYAMKVMRKDRILERDHCDYIKAERDVLTAVLHPYIVALRYSFQVLALGTWKLTVWIWLVTCSAAPAFQAC